MIEDDEFEIDRPKTHVEWILGNQCNYNCRYCHHIFRNGDRPYPSEDVIMEVCQDIVFHFDELGRDVVFNFIGGEPTLAGGLDKISQRLSNHPVDIVLRTNGSASLEWWSDTKNYLSDVVISVHKEFCDLDHIERVIQLLKDDKTGHPVNVSVLIPTEHTDDSWNWAMNTHRRFQKLYQLGEIQMLYSNFAMGSNVFYPYTEKQWKDYHGTKGNPPPPPKDDSPIVYRDQNSFKGYSCYAGIETLTIDHEGRIWRGWCRQGGPIGSIYELPIEWPTDPIICQKDICGNGFDHQAKKELTSS